MKSSLTDLVSTVKEVGVLALVAIALLGANHTFGSWSNPTNTPPLDNADTPINTGPVSQAKNGDIAAHGFSIIDDSTEINFIDLDTTNPNSGNGRIIYMGDRFLLQHDLNRNAASPNWETGFRLQSPLIGTQYAYFRNQVRAASYCDNSGNNCVTAAELYCLVNSC